MAREPINRRKTRRIRESLVFLAFLLVLGFLASLRLGRRLRTGTLQRYWGLGVILSLLNAAR